MKITKTCVYTNRKNSMDIEITEDQYDRYRKGEDIDDVMPSITYEERQFLLTGALPDDEDSLYSDGEDTHDHHHHVPGWEWH